MIQPPVGRAVLLVLQSLTFDFFSSLLFDFFFPFFFFLASNLAQIRFDIPNYFYVLCCTAEPKITWALQWWEHLLSQSFLLCTAEHSPYWNAVGKQLNSSSELMRWYVMLGIRESSTICNRNKLWRTEFSWKRCWCVPSHRVMRSKTLNFYENIRLGVGCLGFPCSRNVGNKRKEDGASWKYLLWFIRKIWL